MAWMDQATALALVKKQCAYDAAPVLTDAEVLEILLRTAHAVVWTPNTAYSYGQKVVPTVRAGYIFEVAVAGTSGAVEPPWPTSYSFSGAGYSGVGGGTPYPLQQYWGLYGGIADGPTLQWVARAPDFDNPYDIHRATYECWLLKGAKASELYNVSVDGQSMSRSDIEKHCQLMADRWAPVLIV